MNDDLIEKLSFEEAMQELELVVRTLEEGKSPLEEAVRLYERGIKLKAYCDKKLKNAQMLIDKISFEGNDELKLSPFENG